MGTVRAMVEPKRTQISVPRDGTGRLIDSGLWRVAGVTHWHLTRADYRISDRERFDNDRVAWARRQRPNRGIARTPHEVVAWKQVAKWAVYAEAGLPVRVNWRLSEEIVMWFAMRGDDCRGLARISEERVAHLDAWAMTAAQCRCDQG